jgi:hypothetical protein
MNREIDALQVQVMKDRGPWYRQVPVVVPLVVSVMAFALALVTTLLSQDQVARKEKHDARVELRALVQRLTALPKENLQVQNAYRDDAAALSQAASTLNTEQIVLAQQAADVIAELGTSVTASEYYAVGYALFTAGDTGASLRLLERGLSKKNALDPVGGGALLRQAALVSFATGDLTRGRQRFQEALDLWGSRGAASSAAPATVQYNAVFTETSWARAELTAGQCEAARQHISRAKAHAGRRDALLAAPVRVQMRALDDQIVATCRAPAG